MEGLRGRLITASFCRHELRHVAGTEPMPAEVARQLARWWHRCDSTLAPTSAARAIADIAALPLFAALGYSADARTDAAESACLRLRAGNALLTVLVLPWGSELATGWRSLVRHAAADGTRWGVCCNGVVLRVIDAHRTWCRDYVEFDLSALGEHPDAQFAAWSLLSGAAMRHTPPLLDQAVELSARYGADVCRALGAGVLESLQLLLSALARGGRVPPPQTLFEQSLTVLYRVLFLLFAEARGLVPMWHPLYRDQYSLGHIVAALLTGRRYRGLWHAVQAISRLAHTGCTAGELRVTAFNGRLFSPSEAAAFDRRPIGDDVMGRAVVAVSSTPVHRGAEGPRRRIAFRDLDVEQLGAVYERVLDYEPQHDPGMALTRTRDVRKSSGAFYTPRAVTAALVRRTLEPLVRDRTADDILRLRVLDPAMGSGAFVVAACRYLAAAAEHALIAEGRWHPHDIAPEERLALRRQIAARCLFGVDINPMAVQLGRLSLWLATLAADKPLSFLDHHLISGDSLVGASIADLTRQPGGGGRRRGRPGELPLFAADEAAAVLESAARTRLELTATPDDNAAAVRAKERRLAALEASDGPLATWWRALDLWCAGWFGAPHDGATYGELLQHVLHARSALPPSTGARLLSETTSIAGARAFLHWELAFPEVFTDSNGHRRGDGGFDAVIGNPPWDMVRGDSGDAHAREARRRQARHLTAFTRESGVYRVSSQAHVNRYQLFVERALQLVRRGGRIGLVLPGGFVKDTGTAPLRRHLFDHASVDAIEGFDNRDGIFPIHRSTRFVLLTCTSGGPTESIRCRFGLTRLDDLDRADTPATGAPLVLTRRLLTALSGDEDIGLPEVTGALDLQILERVAATIPSLTSRDGWQVAFGRELNATDDRAAFIAYSGDPHARPVVEGKQLEPFHVDADQARLALRPAAKCAMRIPRRPRLAYRDVASATNRLTLIAAIVPARAVTTHTLCCLRTTLPLASQQVLCGLLNSFVANYLVRLRVTTHVTVALVSRLRVPLLHPSDEEFARVLSLVRALERHHGRADLLPEYAQLQALVARLYCLRHDEFAHILDTFPLIAGATRTAALNHFDETAAHTEAMG